MVRPTEQCYSELQHAYDFFNEKLFGGDLPQCLITMQRKPRALGFFVRERFANGSGLKSDEIALNPATFEQRGVEDTLSTLVHEMVHLWQHHRGKPSRRGYHNSEWAAKMEDLGLMPSHNGQPGGRRLGQRMSHYVLPGGPFAVACAELLATGFKITWSDQLTTSGSSKKGAGLRTKYRCACGHQVWGKPNLDLNCGSCGRRFHALA